MAEKDSKLWKLYGVASAVLATLLVRRALELTWRVGTGRQPPTNPEHPDVDWFEAVTFALASGAAVGLARMLASRKAADYWRRSTGELPPNLRDVGP